MGSHGEAKVCPTWVEQREAMGRLGQDALAQQGAPRQAVLSCSGVRGADECEAPTSACSITLGVMSHGQKGRLSRFPSSPMGVIYPLGSAA